MKRITFEESNSQGRFELKEMFILYEDGRIVDNTFISSATRYSDGGDVIAATRVFLGIEI